MTGRVLPAPCLAVHGLLCCSEFSKLPTFEQGGTVMRTAPVALFSLILILHAHASGAVVGEPKQPYKDLPDDKARSRTETITQAEHAYRIQFRGSVDGRMTRMPVAYGAYVQGWQPNRSLIIRNVGSCDVVDPRIVVNGKRNWRSLEDVVAEAVGDYTEPADRARAIWEYQRRNRFHACTWDSECSDVIKVLNVYGYTLCGNEAHLLNDLWKAAGLKVRRGYPIGHCVTEAFYDGAYHLLDGDEHVICLKRDNKTIASCAEIVRDHDLVKRTHTYGIDRRDGRQTDEFSAALYWYQGERKGDWGNNTTHAMKMRLRPGESIELRWDHQGKEYSAGTETPKGQKSVDGNGTLIRWGPVAYDKIRNGKLRYRPDLTNAAAQRGIHSSENAVFDTANGFIRPQDTAKPAVITWEMASPWVFVGGKASASVDLGPRAQARWLYSTGKDQWHSFNEQETPGDRELTAVLDKIVSQRGKPSYRFQIRLALEGDVKVKDISFDLDVQTSLLSLPELEVGTNQVLYTDSTEGPRQIRITHRWMERSAWHPPAAPADALAPEDGQTVSGSQVSFRWSPPADPDGDKIADYHFELSEHADMRWPLSPNFEKLISNTDSRGKTEWTVPYLGLLNPDTPYFWRVRALDATGTWGPWSKTFRFQLQAPGVPLEVRLEPSNDGGLALSWQANPQGEPPVAYKVYGSDEKGFTAADAEYLVNMGRGFVRDMDHFQNKPSDAADVGMVKTPANLIATVKTNSLPVVGAGLTSPNTNKAYYRVVAVDAAGRPSGPSDYAEVARPFIFTHPEVTAKTGQSYRYQPGLICSAGDLQCRRSPKSSYNGAFWDREQYTFTPVSLPDGLSIDGTTGLISGRPTTSGPFDVKFTVANQFGAKGEVSYRLTVSE